MSLKRFGLPAAMVIASFLGGAMANVALQKAWLSVAVAGEPATRPTSRPTFAVFQQPRNAGDTHPATSPGGTSHPVEPTTQRSGIQPLEVVRARAFEILDANGKVRASLETPGNDVVLRFKDEAGEDRLWLGIAGAAPLVSMGDTAASLSFGTGPGGPQLSLTDDTGHHTYLSAGIITASTDEGGNVEIESQWPLLTLHRGRGRLKLSGYPPSLTLYRDKEAIIELDGDERAITLYDETGKPRAVLGKTNLVVTDTGDRKELAPSSLVLFDKDGKVVFRAP